MRKKLMVTLLVLVLLVVAFAGYVHDIQAKF